MAEFQSISRLDADCECGSRADFRVVVKENGWQQALYFCRRHLPDEYRSVWRSEEDAEPGSALVKPYDFKPYNFNRKGGTE